MHLYALHVQTNLLLDLALLKQSLNGMHGVLSEVSALLADAAAPIVVCLVGRCTIENALQVNFLTAKLPIVEVGPEVFF